MPTLSITAQHPNMASTIRAHRMAVSLYEGKMYQKYGHGWSGKMLESERRHLKSLERGVNIKTKQVYDLYAAADEERTRLDVAFSEALASIAA